MTPQYLQALLLLLLAMLSIQGGAVFAKLLFPVLGPMGTATVRAGFAALLLLLWLQGRRHVWPKWSRASWAIVGYGAMLGCMNLCFYLALARIPMGIAVTLEFLGPLGLALLLSRRAADLLWVLLAGLGVWFILPHTTGNGLDPLGVLFALLAGLFWALYILLGKRVGQHFAGIQGVALGMAVSALILLPFGAAHLGALLMQPQWLGVALALAVFSSMLPYTLEMHALRTIPTQTFGVLMSLEPAVAALVGLLLLGERLTPLQWLALGCVAVASAGVSWAPRRSKQAS